MKQKEIKVSVERAKAIIDDNVPCTDRELKEVIDALMSASKSCPSWLVVVLKVLAYALGLILAGVGTAATASCVLPLIF